MTKPVSAYGETATQISLNKEYEGTLVNGDRYYTFNLPSDGEITYSVQRNVSSSWYVYLTDANGNTIDYFSTPYGTTVTGKEQREVGLPKGTYYLHFSSYTNGSASPFKFQVDFSAGNTFENEFNNTFEQANPININTVYNGALQTSSDEDYFVFTTPEDGNVTLSMNRNTTASWYVYLYSEAGQTYKYFNTGYGTTATGLEEKQVGLPKGTYIVRVDNYTDTADINYQLQVKFSASSQHERENNDTLETANLIDVNKSYKGVLQETSDDDYFAFTLPNDGNVTLSVNRDKKASWYVYIYSADGSISKYFHTEYGTLATGTDEKQIGLPKGTYYVKIENYNESKDIPYEFQVKFNAGNYYEKESNDSLETANPINLNAVYKGTLQNSSDDDNYAFTVSTIQQVRFSMPRVPGVSRYIYLYDENGGYVDYFHTEYGATTTGNEEKVYSLDPGTYYITVANYSNAADTPYEFALWTASPMLSQEQVTVTNNTGKADSVNVEGLGSGDIVKIYNAASGGTHLATATASSTGTIVANINQIGQKAGKLYITVTKAGWTESNRLAVDFTGEQSTPLVASQVVTENNTGKPDLMTIKNLGANDVVKVYDGTGKLIGVSMPATNGQAAIAFVQLGAAAGKVYATVTRDGMTESTKTTISFVAEALPTVKIQLNGKTFTDGYLKDDAVYVHWQALSTFKIPHTYKGNGVFVIEGRTVNAEIINGGIYIRWSLLSPGNVTYKAIAGGYNFIYAIPTPIKVQLNGQNFTGGFTKNGSAYVHWKALDTFKIPYTFKGNGYFTIEGRTVKAVSINGGLYIHWNQLSPGNVTYKAITGGYNFIYSK